MAARFCRKEREEVASRLHGNRTLHYYLKITENHEEIEEGGGVFEEKMNTCNVKAKI